MQNVKTTEVIQVKCIQNLSVKLKPKFEDQLALRLGTSALLYNIKRGFADAPVNDI